MKGNALCAILFLTGPGPHIAFAQFTGAQYRFSNYLGVDAPVFDADGNRLFGTSYVAVLYGGPTRDSLQVATVGDSSMTPHPFTRTHDGQPGYFGEGGFVTVDNDSCGGYAWLQVRAWDTRLGATYDDVTRLGLGGYGESPLFYTFGGDACSVTGLPPQPLRGLESFSLRPVPEPNTWALLVLGAGWLFWRERRRGESDG